MLLSYFDKKKYNDDISKTIKRYKSRNIFVLINLVIAL